MLRYIESYLGNIILIQYCVARQVSRYFIALQSFRHCAKQGKEVKEIIQLNNAIQFSIQFKCTIHNHYKGESANCPYGKMSIWNNVHRGKCPQGMKCPYKPYRIGKCPLGMKCPYVGICLSNTKCIKKMAKFPVSINSFKPNRKLSRQD